MAAITWQHWLAHLALIPITALAVLLLDEFPLLGTILCSTILVYPPFFIASVCILRKNARRVGSAMVWLNAAYSMQAAIVPLMGWVWFIRLCFDLCYRRERVFAAATGLGVQTALANYLAPLADLLRGSRSERDGAATVMSVHEDNESQGNCVGCLFRRPNCSWSDCPHVLYCMICYWRTINHGGDGRCPYCQKGTEVKRLVFP